MAVNKLNGVYYPPPVEKKVEDQFKEASQMYEKAFLKEMVKAMRTTVPQDGFLQESNGEKIFKDELDNEYINSWAERGGVGIADMIYTQLMEKYGGQNIKIKPQGPISLKDVAQFKGTATTNKNTNTMDWTFKRANTEILPKPQAETPNPQQKIAEIQSPWNGILRDKTPVGDGYRLRIDHENGLTSQIHFRGTPGGPLEKGQKLQAGQRIGLLSPEANEFFWSLGERGTQATEEFGDPASL